MTRPESNRSAISEKQGTRLSGALKENGLHGTVPSVVIITTGRRRETNQIAKMYLTDIDMSGYEQK
jgi:hypothetical protein